MTPIRTIASFSLAAATLTLLATGCAKSEPEALSCVQLDPGQSKVITGKTGTPIAGNYTLTRLSGSAYRATVNPQFADAGGGQSADLQASYRARLAACFARVSPYLKNSDGSTLELRLAEEGSDVPQPSQIPVRADAKSQARGHALFWSSGVNDCPTMLHETLHWLGLPDEYEETQWANECRALGPENSIMRSPVAAYRAVAADVEMTRIVCRCADAACVQEALKGVGTEFYRCPGDATAAVERFWAGEHPEWTEGGVVKTPEGTEVNLHLVKQLENAVEPRSSLLYNGEFRAITQPGCSSVNSLFYSCSHFAYTRVVGVFQLGGECLRSLPSECRDPQRWVQ